MHGQDFSMMEVLNSTVVNEKVLAQMLPKNSKTNENFTPVGSNRNHHSKSSQNESNFNPVLQNKYLMILNLNHVKLRTLPRDLKNLKCLVWLDLSHNQLDAFPNSLSDIPHLRYLNLSHNNFRTVPFVFQTGLQFIRVLDISFNMIKSFDESPCSFNLEVLNISHNKLKHIPDWIFNRTSQIKKLDISNNNLKKMTCTSFLLHNLTFCMKDLCSLNLEDCNLTENELFFMHHMTGLETLQIGNTSKWFHFRNHFKSLSVKKFEKCSQLSYVSANNVGLSVLPNDFGSLNHIHSLNLEKNHLTWLPESFTNLNSLQVCRLSHNSICFLPREFGKLFNLKQIFLNNNFITELPNSFKLLINLEYCDLYCNKLQNFDSKILKLKSLKGIDLERNCLNFQTICGSEKEFEEFCVKYQGLKEYYRNCLNEERGDEQILTEDDTEASMKLEKDECSDESPDYFASTDFPRVQEPSNTENWDEEYAMPYFSRAINSDSDDDFDPNVNYEEELKKKGMNRETDYEGNFLPSEGHVTSLRKYFLRKPNYDPIKDQYDSD